MKIILLIIFTFFTFQLLKAQKIDNSLSYRLIKNDNYIRLSYDNDLFTATDKSYTQGIQLEIAASILKANPINYLFFKLNQKKSKYNLTFDQHVYTPVNIESTTIQYFDRPFSAALILGCGLSQVDSTNKLILTQSLTFGIIGPTALGREMQTFIHKKTNNPIPYGWENQVKNNIILNYNLGLEKCLFRFKDAFALNSNSYIHAGTFLNKVSLGLNLQFGKLNNVLNLSSSSPNLYFAYHVFGSVVVYDATLQGGIFNGKDVYTISSTDITRFTVQQNLCLIFQTKKIYSEIGLSVMSKEFLTSKASKWGGLKIGCFI